MGVASMKLSMLRVGVVLEWNRVGRMNVVLISLELCSQVFRLSGVCGVNCLGGYCFAGIVMLQ